MDITYESIKIEALDAIKATDALLDIPLSDTAHILKQQISDIEVYHHRITNIVCKAERVLKESKGINLIPTGEYKENDRKVLLEAKTAKEKHLYDLLKMKLDDIETRIEAGQSILAFEREIYKKGEQ